MNQNDWDVLCGAIRANLFILDNPNVTIPVWNSPPTNIQELSVVMVGVNREIGIVNTLNFTFAALQAGTNALISAHRLAAAAVVPAPTSANIAEITSDLNTISAAVGKDDKFAQVVQLSGVIVNIANQF